jgi:hypothetical protein
VRFAIARKDTIAAVLTTLAAHVAMKSRDFRDLKSEKFADFPKMPESSAALQSHSCAEAAE